MSYCVTRGVFLETSGWFLVLGRAPPRLGCIRVQGVWGLTPALAPGDPRNARFRPRARNSMEHTYEISAIQASKRGMLHPGMLHI